MYVHLFRVSLQIRAQHEAWSGWFRGQGGQTALGFASETSRLRSGLEGLSGLQGLEHLDCRFRGQIFIIVVVHSQHGGVHTGAGALNLHERELSILGSLSNLDSQVLLDRLQNLC